MNLISIISAVRFDTNHIIEITRGRQNKSNSTPERKSAYEAISRAITQGWVKLLFNPACCFDWIDGNANSKSIQELADFFGTAKLVAEADEQFIYLAELLEEVRRHFPRLKISRIPVIRPVGEIPAEIIQLSKHHPQFAELSGHTPTIGPGPRVGVQWWLRGLQEFSIKKNGIAAERIKGWRDALLQTRNEYRSKNAKGMTQKAKIEWANRAQYLGEILKSSDPELDLSAIEAKIDFARCPACSLYLNALWRYAKAMGQKGPDDNDADDWLQVGTIAHADFSLVERKLHRHLIAGTKSMESKIFSDPIHYVKALRLEEINC